MAMKRPTLVSFHFKNLSNDQDKRSPSTSEENTEACSPSSPNTLVPQKTHNVSFECSYSTLLADFAIFAVRDVFSADPTQRF